MSKCLTRDCDHDAPHGELLCHPCGYGYTPSFINAMRSQHSEPQYKFQTGDLVTKRKGSSWTGRVVGFYSTKLTPEGYAVESLTEKGSVQIYPAAALDLYEQDFAASAAETSTAGMGQLPDSPASQPGVVGGHESPAGDAIGTEAAVCADIASRQRLGIAKYGTTVRDNPLPLREWLQHAYEESLDLPIYLKRSIEELDGNTNDQRQAAEYMAEVLATVKRKTKRMAQQVPQRFHGELFDLAITAARAVAKWEFVNQPNATSPAVGANE